MNKPSKKGTGYCDPVRYARAAADRRGFSFELLDTHSGYLCRISDGERSILIGGGTVNAWPVNNATAAAIATDKGFTTLVLQGKGITVPSSITVFLSERFRDLREGGREITDVPKLADALGWPVIAKPNNGSRGAYVQLCSGAEELQTHLARMSKRYDIALLQQYVPGEEYRVFVYDGSALFSYRKRRAALVCDGTHSIRTLVEEHNEKLIGVGLDPVDIELRAFTEKLAKSGLAIDSTPPHGTLVDVGVRANLSAGGCPEDFTTNVPGFLKEPALASAQELGLVAAGVDIIINKRSTSSQATVLEVNSNPTISSLETVGRLDLAVDIYERLIEKCINRNLP